MSSSSLFCAHFWRRLLTRVIDTDDTMPLSLLERAIAFILLIWLQKLAIEHYHQVNIEALPDANTSYFSSKPAVVADKLASSW